MEILGTVLGPVVEYIISPVGRELGYLFFYKRNIKDFEKQLENLRLVRARVQILVNQEKSNSNEIFKEILTWLDEVDAELSQQNEGGSNRNNGSNLSCLNKLVQCQPRKTKKKVEHVLKLIGDGKAFDKDNIGYFVPLPNTKCSTLPIDYQILESRTLMAIQIKNALADPTVNKVGVSGMGGVGKTKLLDEVKKLVLEGNLFDRVIVVSVGTSKDVKHIQDEIGGMLNMKLEANSEDVRASLLRTKIVEMKDNFLIVLDDLWKEYDLEKDFGIPCLEGCKVVITSRSRDLLTNQFNTEKWFEVNSLSEKESWKFFVAIVGEFVEVGIEHLAKNVVKECGGLPLALKSLAKALKGKKIQVWKDTLKKLKNHDFVGIPREEQKLYNCLKLSYDSIEDEEAKLLFLLCSVFPDDYRILVNDLQMYAMGMGMLNDINQWEDARNRIMKLIDDLTSSYLLIDCNVDHVQMHDVVRDVAKYIASKIYKMPSLTYGRAKSEWQEEDRHGSYNAIFVNCVDFPNLPSNLEFPNLQLLILRGSWNPKDTQIPDAFFEGMENLRVLDMSKVCLEPSGASLTHSLKNLQILCLSDCEFYDIDTIGELKKLKILKINGCKIEELPVTMSQLTELKVLEVLSCSKLEVIHPNIISSMTKLEELSLLCSFRRWGEEVLYKEKIIKNVKLSELNCLTQLSILRIEILNVDILSNELSLERVQKLQYFCIFLGVEPDPFDTRIIGAMNLEISHSQQYRRYTRLLKLNVKSKIVSIGGVLEILLQGCEELHVVDSVGSSKALFKPNANYYGLKHLRIKLLGASDIENISSLFDVQDSFSELKDLTIIGGNNLERLWHNSWITTNSFCKLQKIELAYCHQLKYVFPFNMVESLAHLKILKIRNCDLLERVFEIEQSTEDDVKTVPLTMLKLSYLPNLKYVWTNDPGERLTFPNLNEVKVFRCPRLQSLFPASFIKHMAEIESLYVDGENDIFAEEEASKLMVFFPSLTSLTIHCKVVEKRRFWHRFELFPKLRSLYLIGSKDDGMVTLPIEMSELLYKIEEFQINDCFELVQVFQNGEENNYDQGPAKLKTLCLGGLPNLIHVWKDNTEMTTSFDSLERIIVNNCMKLKCLLPLSITFVNLTMLSVNKCNGMMNLFSSSVAKKLVNLRTMFIVECEGMSSIIEAEGDAGEAEISFNRMNHLSLSDLPRLTSFHSGKSKLKFPCLDKLSIGRCPQMKTFSYEISMPKLQFLEFSCGKVLENVPVLSTKGLNGIIQDLCTDEIVRSTKNFVQTTG